MIIAGNLSNGPVLDAASPGKSEASRNRQLLGVLLKAYKGPITGVEDNHIIWADGTKMVFDDGIPGKSLVLLATSPDLEDHFTWNYPGPGHHIPPQDQDPGGIRYLPFLKKLYGETRREVEANLVKVPWIPAGPGKHVSITKICGIDRKVHSIAQELAELPPHFRKYVDDPPDTYHWRKIPGTDRLSSHSFGIALDLAIPYADYWRWRSGKSALEYRNRIPLEIVRIFEKHGFIWGGRWYHFDTMHFEYRPEMLLWKEVQRPRRTELESNPTPVCATQIP